MICRSTFYHVPRYGAHGSESAQNLAPMGMIDHQFLETPCYGARQMTWHPRAEGHPVNIKRAHSLMRLLVLLPIYRQQRTSVPAKEHELYRYLLRGTRIE